MIPQSMGARRDVLADKVHWAGVANGVQPPSEARLWDTRGQIIAQFVRPGDKVLDLGAGKQKLKSYLPATCSYVPVDCVAVHPGTFVVDFNEEFRLPKEPVDVIVSSGFLEYIVNSKASCGTWRLRRTGVPWSSAITIRAIRGCSRGRNHQKNATRC